MELLRSFPDCGDLEDDTKREHPIAAAIETAEGEFPWMALLKYETAGRPFLCGGSLITNRFVLTAAHCATAHVQLIGVRLGEHNLDTEQDCLFHDGIKIACPPPYEEYGIEEIRIHPKYMKGSISHDIALIKLDKNVEFKSHIGPICLPINYTLKEFDPDQIFNIAGWGKTEDDRPSSILLKAEVKHQHRSICRTFYENSPVSENHICAVGEGRQATCLGDSGGPLFYRYRDGYIQRFFQAGVISFGGQGCGVNKNQPGVFASILDMLPWITQNLY
ncbi:hypothetical protein KR044_007760 [Drosophila immigrans]|nr:hypothetical protein KR044_007760 [Drosophila immigrans]